MSSVLIEHQHELCDANGDNGVVFGTVDTGYLTLTRPLITPGDVRTNDLERPQEDGITLGRDYRGAKTFSFEMEVITDRINHLDNGDAHRANLDALSLLETHWNAQRWRNDPRAFAVLRSCEGGEVSRCYGRPRRWDETAGPFTQIGLTPVVADFQLIDDQWYSDDEHVFDIGMAPSSVGGFIAPIIAPLTTTLIEHDEASMMTVTGARPTWPVVEFHGPVINPEVQIGNVRIGLLGGLTYDQTVTVDPRPWARTVIRNPGNVGVAGWLASYTPLMRNMLVEPGAYSCTLRGVDVTGTAFVRVFWRNARARP